MNQSPLKAGFRQAKKITKQFAKSFYLASLFLPPGKKNASYAVYALCRLSDEAVDNLTAAHPAQSLQKLEQNIHEVYTQKVLTRPLLAAFKHTVTTYRIPKEYFDTLIQGMRMDLESKRYASFPELYEYCYRAAGVVGLIMLKIFGCQNQAAQPYAVKLGVAMQLTNILRDINEDLLRNRIYLPQDELLAFAVNEKQLALAQNNEAFKNLMRFQIQRCHKLYAESLPGIKLIGNRCARLVALVMHEVYQGILDAIRDNNYNVFTKRAQVNTIKKIRMILRILWERKYL